GVQQSIVARGPEHAPLDRRFGEREDGAVVLRAGVVFGDRCTGWRLLRSVVPREVRADALPGRAFVGSAEDVVAGVIENVRVVGRVHSGRGPLDAVLDVLGPFAGARFGPDHDVPRLPGAAVEPSQEALVVAGEDHVRVIRPDRDVARFASADREAVGRGDAGDRRAARPGHGGVVLLRAVDALR